MLSASSDEARPVPPEHAALTAQMRDVLSQRNYPCIAALRSFFRDDYLVGIYEGFGRGHNWADLRRDLLSFVAEAQRSSSPYLTMWAVFPDAPSTDEETFEASMWEELSHLTSLEKKAEDWGAAAPEVSDPGSRAFSLRLEGHDLFVVGLHPNSSRLARRLPWTALVFNAFDQFERLKEEGVYDRMVETNRKKDVRLPKAKQTRWRSRTARSGRRFSFPGVPTRRPGVPIPLPDRGAEGRPMTAGASWSPTRAAS